jgi:hypothetical protein
MWENPTMTAIADNKKRVTIRTAKPGDRFDVQVMGEKIVLTRLVPKEQRQSKVRFIKKNGYTVGLTDNPIDEQTIKEALADFP